jgi:hypothetical protein
VSRRSVIILIVGMTALIAAMCVGAFVLVSNSRAPQTHLVPDGYTGWVSVTYSVEGAPPLPIEDDHRVFRYDTEGKLETSSPYEEGWGVDDYFYVAGQERQLLRQRPSGVEGEIWGPYTSTELMIIVDREVTRQGVSTGFFVGAEEEWRANPRP